MITHTLVPGELPRTKQGVTAGVRVLQRALEPDPLFQFLFSHQNRDKDISVFFTYMIRKSTLLKEKALYIPHNGQPVCVANLELPTSKRNFQMFSSPLFIMETLVLMFKLPKRIVRHLNSYMKYTTLARPDLPHHYLTFIGVDPEHQGQGIGKIMLEHLHSLVESDPHSCGIGLDTENPANVLLYEHLGYKLTGEHTLGNITIYCMFRNK